MTGGVATGSGWEIREGRWQDALADIETVAAVITDPPYGAATHEGHAGRTRTDIRDPLKMPAPLPYSGWGRADVVEFVDAWAPRCRGWFVAMTSHDLYPVYRERLEAADRYVFAPLPLVTPGMSIRLCGDGPSSWTVWLVVARPRSLSKWGTLPGAYNGRKPDSGIPGGKNLEVVRAIVRDYSRVGDLVCDPCAGGGTTIVAAAMERRSGIGAEVDPETFATAHARLGRGHTPDLFGGQP